jgi:hypothetical protein
METRGRAARPPDTRRLTKYLFQIIVGATGYTRSAHGRRPASDDTRSARKALDLNAPVEVDVIQECLRIGMQAANGSI